MTTEVEVAEPGAVSLERVVVAGDLAKLSAADRVMYYHEVCRSLGLNPLTKPFQYIVLNGKLTLYATRTATDQLRALKGISIDRIEQEEIADLYIATVYGRDRTGRTDSEVGAVSTANLKGENRANAIMKAITKAKRRLTLSLSGLGWLDEMEVATVPSAEEADVDAATGEIRRLPPRPLAERVAERAEALAGARTDTQTPTSPGNAEASPVPPVDEPMPAPDICGKLPPFDTLEMTSACDRPTGHKGPHHSEQGTWPA